MNTVAISLIYNSFPIILLLPPLAPSTNSLSFAVIVSVWSSGVLIRQPSKPTAHLISPGQECTNLLQFIINLVHMLYLVFRRANLYWRIDIKKNSYKGQQDQNFNTTSCKRAFSKMKQKLLHTIYFTYVTSSFILEADLQSIVTYFSFN